MAKKKKRVVRKLTERVKQNIKDAKGRVPLKDYDGEAYTYLLRYRALAKARKVKKDTTLKIKQAPEAPGLTIKKNTKLYQRLAKVAELKGITVKQLYEQFPEEINRYMRSGSFHEDRETDYLLDDLDKLSEKVQITVGRHGVQNKGVVMFNLKQLQMNTANYTEIYFLIFKCAYSLDGMKLRLNFPFVVDYEDLLFEIDSNDYDEDSSDHAFSEMIEGYKEIIIVRSPKK